MYDFNTSHFIHSIKSCHAAECLGPLFLLMQKDELPWIIKVKFKMYLKMTEMFKSLMTSSHMFFSETVKVYWHLLTENV